MQSLNTQAEFEVLWTAAASVGGTTASDISNNRPWLVYFTKNDCPPCALLDKDAILSATLIAGLRLYVVNLSINKYTPGFCNVNRFPTFALMKPRKIIATLTSSKTEAVITWINDFVASQ
jgi:hypothetical protein